jgi:MinD-like ATPase involved in chromosome partitioning or flagellar assembly
MQKKKGYDITIKGKKVIIYSLKGSQGKTTIAVAIALELGWQIITNDAHSEEDLVKIVGAENVMMLDANDKLPTAKELEEANIVFDPGGFLDPRMIEALKMSDHVIIPVVNLSSRSLEASRFIASVYEVEQYNKNIVFLLNMVESKESTDDAKKAIKEMGYKYPIFEIKKTELFENMIRSGTPISKIIQQSGLYKRWFESAGDQVRKLINHIK